MNNRVTRSLVLVVMFAAIIGCLFALDSILMSRSSTYMEIAEEIDQRDIDTGNALNYLGDETSSKAVHGAAQTLEHPPMLK